MQEILFSRKPNDRFASQVVLDISARSGVIADANGRVINQTNMAVNNTIIKGGPSMQFNGQSSLWVDNQAETNLWLQGDFCIDVWLYLTARQATFPSLFGNYSAWPNNNGMQLFAGHASYSTTKFAAAISGGFPAIRGNIDIPYNQWFHYATERNKGVLTTYIRGVFDAATQTVNNNQLFGTKDRVSIGVASDDLNGGSIVGMMDRYRITTGVRYGGPFTPETF